jgi:hypothetical protein
MAKPAKYTSYQIPVITDLPAAMMREIGRIVVNYASLEHSISRIIYHLLGISRKEGRLAAKEPRATDRFEIVRDLLVLQNIKPKAGLIAIRKEIEAVATMRDKLAHGIWTRHPRTNATILQIKRGKFQPNPPQNTKRVISPEGIPFNVDDCRAVRIRIEQTIETIDRLAFELGVAPPSSPEKST